VTRLALALILLVAVQGRADAQLTGRVEGRVFDAETGEPLVGGQVRIVQAALGNVTRGDGSFFIERVPVGLQFVQTEYLGYREESREARILPGRTTRLDFALGGTVVDTPTIVATIVHEPWIPKVTLPVRPAVHSVPDRLPSSTAVARCEVQAVLHGTYILDGRWELQTSVGDLHCWPEEDDAEVAPCDRRTLNRTR
jgi:hypothetical protein